MSQYGLGLGPWLYAHALAAYPKIQILLIIEDLHGQIHKLAAHTEDLLRINEVELAKTVFDQILALNNIFCQKLATLEQENPIVSHTSQDSFSYEPQKTGKQELLEVMIDKAPAAMMIMTGPDHVISIANQRMLDMLGKGSAIIGKPAWLAVPEIQVQPYLAILDSVLQSGKAYAAKGMPGHLSKDGVESNHYFDFTYSPLLDSKGIVYGVIAVTAEVTENVMSDLATQKSQTALREAEKDNQIKTAVLDYCELIIGISYLEPMPEPLYNNQYTLQKLGWQHNKGRTLIDAVYPEDREFVLGVLPEIFAQKGGSHEIRLWNEVTEEPFWVQWNVMVIDNPQTGLPAILATVSPDITERKEQQLLMQQQQQSLLNAIEVAQLGTWSMDIATQKTTFSRRHLDMFGVSAQEMSLTQAIGHVIEGERQGLADAFFYALHSESDGNFEAEYTIRHAITNQLHIIHSKGQTIYDTSGNAVSISGIAQDVTVLRNQQQTLESLVERRTQELDATNKELAIGNQKLQYANLLLSRSNEDLNRFAYVASHDLQEPLRKIQQFGSRLNTEYEAASPKAKDYLQRMIAAVERMSNLISDLLTFSRISTNDAPTQSVSLHLLIQQVLIELDVQITEANAVFEIGSLPELEGNPTHLGQLFQNLISNAIKFRKTDDAGAFIPPTIKIYANKIASADLPVLTQPSGKASYYHQINVSDNGIGFNEIYLDRIFQVFQRLHGRSEYSGTGIGLAICERIVTSLGGVITASSVPGAGATFQIYIPQT